MNDLSTGSDGELIVFVMTIKFDELKCDFDRIDTDFQSVLALKNEEIFKLSAEVKCVHNKVSHI